MDHTESKSLLASSNAFSLFFPNLDVLLTMISAANRRVYLSKNRKKLQWTFIPEERETYFLTSATTTLNNCLNAPRAGSKNDVEKTFATQTTPFMATRFNRQRFPWLFQTTQLSRRKLVWAQKTKSRGSVDRVQSFIARHAVVDENVRTVDGNARKYNFWRTKWFDHSATCARSTVLDAFCGILSLPPQRTEVALFTNTNYKSYSSMSLHVQNMNTAKCLICMGTGLNLIGRSLLHTTWSSSVKRQDFQKLFRSANKQPILSKGVILLHL